MSNHSTTKYEAPEQELPAVTSSSLASELEQSVEHLSDEQFRKLLNGVANHEAKLLTTAVLATHPDRWFSRTALLSEMLRIQGDNPAWAMNKLVPSNYCDQSLGPIGAVVIDEIEGKRGPVHSFKISSFGRDYGLALAGGLLDWSLAYPELSLQKVLGGTQSSGEVRPPTVRWRILSELVTSPADEISFTDMKQSTGIENYSYNNLINHLREMAELDLLQVHSKLDEFNPIYSISSPKSRYNLKETSTTNQAIYGGMQLLHDRGIREVTLHDLVEASIASTPNADMQQVYYRLVKGTREKTQSLPGLVITDRNGAPIKTTTVKLNEAAVEPVSDLLEQLEEVRDGKNFGALHEKAKAILSDPDKCSALLEKAKTASVRYAAKQEAREDTYQRIINILRESNSLSAAEVRDELKNRGDEMHLRSVMVALGELARTGRLQATKVRRDPTRLIKVNKYSVPDN